LKLIESRWTKLIIKGTASECEAPKFDFLNFFFWKG
jgi:hypothetical protein